MTNKNHYVYIIHDTECDKYYIGKRSTTYKIEKDGYSGSGIIINRIVKKHISNKDYLKKRFVKTILEVSSDYEQNAKNEKKWCALFDAAKSKEFYNIHEGGRGGNTHLGWNEDRRKEFSMNLSKRMKGKFVGKKNPMYGVSLPKEKCSMYGKRMSETTKQKLIEISKKRTGQKNHMYGKHNCWGRHKPESIDKMRKPKTEEHKRKISEAAKGINNSQYGKPSSERQKEVARSRTGEKNAHSKPVILINTNETFFTVKEASIKYGIDNSDIVKCCKGKLKFAGRVNEEKAIWKYNGGEK